MNDFGFRHAAAPSLVGYGDVTVDLLVAIVGKDLVSETVCSHEIFWRVINVDSILVRPGIRVSAEGSFLGTVHAKPIHRADQVICENPDFDRRIYRSQNRFTGN
jgi:hypothetical protein